MENHQLRDIMMMNHSAGQCKDIHKGLATIETIWMLASRVTAYGWDRQLISDLFKYNLVLGEHQDSTYYSGIVVDWVEDRQISLDAIHVLLPFVLLFMVN